MHTNTNSLINLFAGEHINSLTLLLTGLLLASIYWAARAAHRAIQQRPRTRCMARELRDGERPRVYCPRDLHEPETLHRLRVRGGC